jgi:outer membrane immunogenic protein
VLGTELSGDGRNGAGSANGASPPLGVSGGQCPFACFSWSAEGEERASASIDSLFLAVARTGYAWDTFMIYAKGGFASAEIGTNVGLVGEASAYGCFLYSCSNASFDWSASGSTEKRHTGFALGTGFEWMVWRNVSLGVDYTYVNLGSETHTGTLNGDVTFCGECGFDFAKGYKISVDPDDIHYVNARLTMHFNGPSP